MRGLTGLFLSLVVLGLVGCYDADKYRYRVSIEGETFYAHDPPKVEEVDSAAVGDRQYRICMTRGLKLPGQVYFTEFCRTARSYSFRDRGPK